MPIQSERYFRTTRTMVFYASLPTQWFIW